MRIQAGDVRPGKCFVTGGDSRQVRRVRSVAEGVVHYEARGSRPPVGAWPSRAQSPIEAFLGEIEREVGPDHVLSAAPRLNL